MSIYFLEVVGMRRPAVVGTTSRARLAYDYDSWQKPEKC